MLFPIDLNENYTIEIEFTCNNTGVTLNATFMTELDGEVVINQFPTIISVAYPAKTNTFIKLSGTKLLGIWIDCTDSNQSNLSAFAKVFLCQGSGASKLRIFNFGSGMVDAFQSLTFPPTIQQLNDGRSGGYQTDNIGGTPGAPTILTISTDSIYVPQFIFVDFVASAAVADRFLFVTFADASANILGQVYNDEAITATQSVRLIFDPSVTTPYDVSTVHLNPLPQPVLAYNSTITVDATNLQAGDNFTVSNFVGRLSPRK